MKKIIILIAAALVSIQAQFNDFHPELNWFTIKGEKVVVHYHEGAERTARVVCKIGDEIWGPITSLYEYEPDVVHYVIKDIDDYSNGATYFFDNKIEIWTSALDSDLRGTHNWLRNVISHEFTHMVQIQASLKTSRRVPAFYLQWLNYEDERRPDILYGFPNIIVSYPLASLNMPAWFAEGTAQYMRSEFNYDNWDTHRDMILRSYVLDGNMLTWNQMGVFGKNSLGNESVYNSGFAFTRYISQKYGEDKLREITKALGKLSNFTIDAAIKDVLGLKAEDIYYEWKETLKEDYNKRLSTVLPNLVVGDTLMKDGTGNFYSLFSPDGEYIFFTSNRGYDYLSMLSLYKYSLETGETELVKAGVKSQFSFIPGTNKIIYSKISDDNNNWYNVHDLYVYDLGTKDETRLTNNLRADQPNVSVDGKEIVFIFQRDGTTNLGIVNIEGKEFRQITFFNNGEQVYNPKYLNGNESIVFDYSYHHTRDIATVNSDGSDLKFIIQTDKDERNPFVLDSSTIYYSSDKTGIFNVYKYNLETKEETQITNVTGGAFMPSVSNKGEVAYSGYTSGGYKIFKIKTDRYKDIPAGSSYVWLTNPPLESSKPNGDIDNFKINKLRNFDDHSTPEYKQEKYSGSFSSLMFFPFVRYDNYNTSNKFTEKIKPGLYVTSSDMLNRYAIFAGASINSRMERDLFLQFEYRNKLPILFNLGIKPEVFLELYNISRKADVDVLIDEFDPIKTDVTYSLFEFDIAAKHKFITSNQNLEFRYIFSSYTATIGSFIFPNSSTLYPTNYDTYFIGSNFQLTYNANFELPYIDSDINPLGGNIELKYNYEMDRYNPDGEYTVEDGTLVPQYKNFKFHKLELNTGFGMPLWKSHSLYLKLRANTIFGPPIPDFFDSYLGGLVGMKAYPFYAISGNELFWMNLTYRFPLFRNIDKQVGHLYIDKIFLSVYGDFGNAWNTKIPAIKDFKKGAGAELRFALNSFYLFPTSVFINASYGFDRVERVVRDEVIKYGKEWRFYGGILFGFEY